MRERMLAVIQGREHDRVPFVQYDGLAGANEEIWSAIGRDNMGILRWSSVHRFEHPNCRFESEDFERDGRRARRTMLHTPAGSLSEERIFEPALGTSAIHAHYIKEPDDYRIFMAYLRDVIVHKDTEHFHRDQYALGNDGLPMVTVGRTPFQQLWIQWVSLERLSLHLVDEPQLLDECIGLLSKIMHDIFEVVRQATDEAPIPFIDFGDNITAPAIGVEKFQRFCVPFYNELADVLSDKNVPVFVHMDGDLKPLWDAISESKVSGIDSLSPPPDNDTSIAQASAMWPEKRYFVNFPSSVHLAAPEKIYAKTMEFLEAAGNTGRLQIQISENVPPGVWRSSFPEIVRAIHDFGKPGTDSNTRRDVRPRHAS